MTLNRPKQSEIESITEDKLLLDDSGSETRIAVTGITTDDCRGCKVLHVAYDGDAYQVPLAMRPHQGMPTTLDVEYVYVRDGAIRTATQTTSNDAGETWMEATYRPGSTSGTVHDWWIQHGDVDTARMEGARSMAPPYQGYVIARRHRHTGDSDE